MDRTDQGASLSVKARAIASGMPSTAFLLVVNASEQRMSVLGPGGEILHEVPVSTSQYGLGEQRDSYRTPRGVHEVVERYGDGLPAGAVLVSRMFTGEVVPEVAWTSDVGDDKILTRILRLAGCEPGMNQGGELDSYARMIYIHGTNHEQWVGITPASRGCIRIKNRDMVDVFDTVKDSPVWVVIES